MSARRSPFRLPARLSFRTTLTLLFLLLSVPSVTVVGVMATRQLSRTLDLLNAPGVQRALDSALDVSKALLARWGDEAARVAESLSAEPALLAEPDRAQDALTAWGRATPVDFAAVYRPGRDGRLRVVAQVVTAQGAGNGVKSPPPIGEEEIFQALHADGIATHGGGTVAAVRRLGSPAHTPPDGVLVVGVSLADGTFARVQDVAQGTSYYRWLGLYREASRRAILLTTGVVGLALLVLVLVASFWLARVVARPVAEMAEAMQRIAAGEPHVRVAPAGAHELARLAESLNAMAAELDAQREAISRADRLAAARAAAEVAAHEIGNAVLPLPFAARRLTKMLEARGEADPAVARSVESITHAVDSLQELTKRFAAFASTETTVMAACAVNEVASLVTEMYATTGDVRMHLDADAGMVHADRGLLTRAVTNLVKNALEAAGPGGRVDITTARRQDETRGAVVDIEVTDSGPGIPPERLASIFQPYTSYKSPRGTGLGLAITADIAARHGGRLIAENRAAGGARFVLTLPVDGPPAAADKGGNAS